MGRTEWCTIGCKTVEALATIACGLPLLTHAGAELQLDAIVSWQQWILENLVYCSSIASKVNDTGRKRCWHRWVGRLASPLDACVACCLICFKYQISLYFVMCFILAQLGTESKDAHFISWVGKVISYMISLSWSCIYWEGSGIFLETCKNNWAQ